MALFEKLIKEPEASLVGRELLSKLKEGKSVSLGPLGEEAKRSLDSLYEIETIDLKSVRRIGEREEKQAPVKEVVEQGAEQTLPLGGRFRLARRSFVLAEPIYVLGLSQHLEKLLIDGGKRRLGDLYLMESCDYLEMKGLGQGHIDEVQKKLREYLAGKVVENAPYVDFAAILRSLAVNIPPSLLATAASPYSLSHLIPLKASEKAEMRKKLEIREGDLEGSRPLLQFALKEVAEVYLIPWMERRGGVATKAELYERVAALSLNGEETFEILRFFEEEFSLTLFEECIQLREGLFATDAFSARRFGKVIESADSYLKSSETPYQLSQLIQWISREFAARWEVEEESYLKRALRLFPDYTIWMGPSGLELSRKTQASQPRQGWSPTGS